MQFRQWTESDHEFCHQTTNSIDSCLTSICRLCLHCQYFYGAGIVVATEQCLSKSCWTIRSRTIQSQNGLYRQTDLLAARHRKSKVSSYRQPTLLEHHGGYRYQAERVHRPAQRIFRPPVHSRFQTDLKPPRLFSKLEISASAVHVDRRSCRESDQIVSLTEILSEIFGSGQGQQLF